MADIEDGLREIGRRVEEQVEHINTEAGTRQALVEPFIKEVLGFDPSNVREVRPEFTADVGTKQGEKVDYAIQVDDKPIILIEVKKVGTKLAAEEPHQLYRYFNTVSSARFGIFTNGVRYLFYSDLSQPNVMDQRPFFEIDFDESLDHAKVSEIKKFTKSEFDAESILASANRLKYTNAVKVALQEEFSDPSEDLVKLLMKRANYEGLRTRQRVQEFQQYTTSAASQWLAEAVREKLNAALASNEGQATEESTTESPADDEGDEIITTADEWSAFYSVKSILHGLVEQPRVTMRDLKNVCLILLDDNRRQWIARLYFGGRQYRLGLPDADGNERRIDIGSPDDIFDFADDVRGSLRRLI